MDLGCASEACDKHRLVALCIQFQNAAKAQLETLRLPKFLLLLPQLSLKTLG